MVPHVIIVGGGFGGLRQSRFVKMLVIRRAFIQREPGIGHKVPLSSVLASTKIMMA
jgi:NADH dehydrogenase FAD-containing subunit